MEPSSLFALLAFVAACLLAAIPGAVSRPGGWYERLVKPRWRPPNWLFAPIWTVLYLTVAVSGWLVWREAGIAGAALPLAIKSFTSAGISGALGTAALASSCRGRRFIARIMRNSTKAMMTKLNKMVRNCP